MYCKVGSRKSRGNPKRSPEISEDYPEISGNRGG